VGVFDLATALNLVTVNTLVKRMEDRRNTIRNPLQTLDMSPNGLPFEARTSRNGANKREMLTAELTAEPRENQRKWETSVNKTAQAKNHRAAQEATQQDHNKRHLAHGIIGTISTQKTLPHLRIKGTVYISNRLRLFE
jgi:hypothetical protein